RSTQRGDHIEVTMKGIATCKGRRVAIRSAAVARAAGGEAVAHHGGHIEVAMLCIAGGDAVLHESRSIAEAIGRGAVVLNVGWRHVVKLEAIAGNKANAASVAVVHRLRVR